MFERAQRAGNIDQPRTGHHPLDADTVKLRSQFSFNLDLQIPNRRIIGMPALALNNDIAVPRWNQRSNTESSTGTKHHARTIKLHPTAANLVHGFILHCGHAMCHGDKVIHHRDLAATQCGDQLRAREIPMTVGEHHSIQIGRTRNRETRLFRPVAQRLIHFEINQHLIQYIGKIRILTNQIMSLP